ncbi:hypothetical protein [Fluviicola sp.]|uniref:hypothetical protein n=1 Tax=Fluviicola sp. TaxID=1917219 RepID=UPI003D27B74E
MRTYKYGLPPLVNPDDFEEFVRDVFNELEHPVSYSKFGTKGQNQYGFDIYSSKKVIQCKVKESSNNKNKIIGILIKDLRTDYMSFIDYNLSLQNPYTTYVFAHTFKNDTKIDEVAREISTNGVNIEHWSWERLTENLSNQLLEKYFRPFSSNYYSNSKSERVRIEITYPFDNHLEALDRIKETFDKLFKSIDTIPSSLLNRLFFHQIDASFSYYNLSFEDKYLYEILNNKKLIDIQIPQTNENLEKIRFIKRKLLANNIYTIEYDYQTMNIDFTDSEQCDCFRCKVERFNFNSINQEKRIDDETEFEFFLKRSFTWLKLGNFQVAYLELKRALEIAEGERNELYIFRAKYNLNKLYVRLRNQVFLGEEYNSILEELKNIEFNPFDFDFKEELTVVIAEWMSNENYIKEAFLDISHITEKLVESHRISHNGGHSNNGLINQLSFKYSQIHSFLQNNLFHFEDFIEWRNIVSVFIEGILASYSTNDGSSKLIELNDWELHQFLKFGDVKKMRVLMQQYKLKDVRYKESFVVDSQITSLIDNLLSINSTEIGIKFFQNEYSKDVFKDKYKEWIHNAMFLLGLIGFKRKFIKNSIIKIIDKIEKEGIEFDISYFQSLLIRRCDVIDQKMLKMLIKIGLMDKKNHRPFFLSTTAILAEENGMTVKFPMEEFESMKYPIRHLKYRENSALIYLAKVLENKQKDYVIDQIKVEMNSEDLFHSAPLYLKAVLNKLVDLDIDLLEKCIVMLTPNAPILSNVSVPIQREAYNYNLNELIDVFYQYDISVLNYPGLLNHSDYYQWLLQLDDFNYSKFKPEWILLHNNRFNYDSRFKKCEPLKNYLAEYIKPIMSISDSKVKERYYEIYI